MVCLEGLDARASTLVALEGGPKIVLLVTDSAGRRRHECGRRVPLLRGDGARLDFHRDARVDRSVFIASLEPFGLTDPTTYIAAAVFWTVGNSVLEEYVFRWFLVEKGEVVFGSSWATIFVSAGNLRSPPLFCPLVPWFHAFCQPSRLVGALRWRCSVQLALRALPKHLDPHITHAMCDVVVFAIGYLLLFG